MGLLLCFDPASQKVLQLRCQARRAEAGFAGCVMQGNMQDLRGALGMASSMSLHVLHEHSYMMCLGTRQSAASSEAALR